MVNEWPYYKCCIFLSIFEQDAIGVTLILNRCPIFPSYSETCRRGWRGKKSLKFPLTEIFVLSGTWGLLLWGQSMGWSPISMDPETQVGNHGSYTKALWPPAHCLCGPPRSVLRILLQLAVFTKNPHSGTNGCTPHFHQCHWIQNLAPHCVFLKQMERAIFSTGCFCYF